MRPEANHNDGKIVKTFRNFIFSEKHNPEEARFHEECENRFRRERTPENIADVARVARPVRAELKFKHDARGDAEGENQRKNFCPVIGERTPFRSFKFVGEALNNYQKHTQADRKRREQKVKSGGEGELNSSKQFGFHNGFIIEMVSFPSAREFFQGTGSKTGSNDFFFAFPLIKKKTFPPQNSLAHVFFS